MSTDAWNREQLYREVWETPLVKLAASYDVSTHVLGNVCRRLQIPLPPRGYWTQKEFGKHLERTSLPKATNLPVIERIERDLPAATRSETSKNDPELVRIATVEVQNLSINPEAKRHKLVATARRILRDAQMDSRGILIAPRYGETCLAIRASKIALERALDLVNTIIVALENEGFPVTIQDGPQATGAQIFGQRVGFCLVEKACVTDRKEVTESSWTRTVVDYAPTGRLEFRIDGYGTSPQTVWRDSKRRKLENLLSQCVAGLMRWGRKFRIDAEARKQQEIEEQKQRKELEILAQQIKEEEDKVQALVVLPANLDSQGLVF
ncbi:MAG: hypothetical protein WBX13_13200 [Candidatus Acidiferrales bacterium]